MSESAFSAAKRHSIYKIANTPVRRYPFPHIYVEGIFPDAFYDEMQRRMLDASEYVRLVDTGRVTAEYHPARLCLFQERANADAKESEDMRFWADLFAAYNAPAFTNLWTSVFRSEIETRITAGQVPPGISGNSIQLNSEIFLIRDGETYGLRPHTDSPKKVASVLFYLPRDASRQNLGTSLYLPKQQGFTSDGLLHLPREDFDLVTTMPYRPNSLFAFPRLENSFHGVEGDIAEPRDVLLFDIKFRSQK